MGSLATLGAESVPQLMSSCPHVDVVLGGVVVPCLVDNGSMVSTITEGFFSEHFVAFGPARLQSCHWLQFQAANGLAIPYVGYIEVDMELCGKVMPRRGVLVVKDPPGSPRGDRDECPQRMLCRVVWGVWFCIV